VPSQKDFRRIALGLDGVVESAHMGHPDFRANGRIFATISIDPQWGSAMLTPEQQRRFLGESPESFKPVNGAWGRGGATSVHLPTVDEDALGEALTLAWQNNAAQYAKAGAKRAKKRTATTTKRRR